MRCRCRISANSTLIATLALLGIFSSALRGAEPATPSVAEKKLQAIVGNLKSRLLITSPIVVTIVPSKALMMSVVPPSDSLKTFLLSVVARFLQTLTDDELEAAIAHELGHVWIFTHHPYLQTEELANKIAMRAVKRDSLERVYAKVWERGGTKGDLAWFLGTAPPASAAGLATDTSR